MLSSSFYQIVSPLNMSFAKTDAYTVKTSQLKKNNNNAMHQGIFQLIRHEK